MADSEFLRPRLCGARFDGGSIPLDVLGDLKALGVMLIEVAKWVFLQKNPERQRSPRGFADGVELKLIRIEDGSAVPVIGIESSSPQRFLDSPVMPFPYREYFGVARDKMVSAIAAVESGEAIAGHLPQKCLCHFDRVGRSLQDGEAIEFSSPSAPQGARLTRESRRTLVLASARQELTEPRQLRGFVPEVDQDKRTFHLQLISGGGVQGPMPDEHFDSLLEAFNGYSERTWIRLDGIVRLNRQERLVGIQDIQQVALLDPLDIAARLAELRELKDGWLDGKGVAPAPPGLEWLKRLFEERYPDELPLPHLCPTADGGVHAEWSFPPVEVGVDIDLMERRAVWYSVDMGSDKDDTRDLNLDDDQEWAWFVDQIRGASCPRS